MLTGELVGKIALAQRCGLVVRELFVFSQRDRGSEAQSSMAAKRNGRVLLRAFVPLCLCVEIAVLGCGTEPEPAKPAVTAQIPKPKAPTKKSPPKPDQPPATQQAPPNKSTTPAAPLLPEKSLSDLAARAAAEEFRLPEIDDAKATAAGIRKLAGKHLILYTDLPPAADVDELPTVFDQAVPLWCGYFAVPREKTAEWKLVGYLIRDKERFVGAGLFPPTLPDFQSGFQRESEFWWFEQPSAYYRRHLMLHEGTHAFMNRWLGGAGPPWYMEGMAELLGLHAWQAGKLTLAVAPKSSEEVPYWGRVKSIRDDFEAGRGLTLEEVFAYDSRAHLRVEAYAWSWAATMFLDAHPLTQPAFRDLKSKTRDRSRHFSDEFRERLAEHWPAIREDWQLCVANIEYGYDAARSAVVRKAEVAPLPASGAKVTIIADRGWQSTGIALAAGKKYQFAASGRYQIAAEPKVWWCEPGGVTIRYYRGQPLGMLLAAVGDVEQPSGAMTPLAAPQPIGLGAVIEPALSGTLYLKINDSPAELADNEGSLTVEIRPQ